MHFFGHNIFDRSKILKAVTIGIWCLKVYNEVFDSLANSRIRITASLESACLAWQMRGLRAVESAGRFGISVDHLPLQSFLRI